MSAARRTPDPAVPMDRRRSLGLTIVAAVLAIGIGIALSYAIHDDSNVDGTVYYRLTAVTGSGAELEQGVTQVALSSDEGIGSTRCDRRLDGCQAEAVHESHTHGGQDEQAGEPAACRGERGKRPHVK